VYVVRKSPAARFRPTISGTIAALRMSETAGGSRGMIVKEPGLIGRSAPEVGLRLQARIDELDRRGERAALCTVIRTRGSVPRHPGSKMLVLADGQVEGSVGGGEMESRVIRDALEALRDGTPRLVSYSLLNPNAGDPGVCGGEVEIFVEPLEPRPTILVIGGGHVGRAIVHLAQWLGFRVVLADDRPEYCSREAAPGADEYRVEPIAELARTFPFSDSTYIVMPTRGMPLDVEGLPHLFGVPHAYLGIIGSRRRWATAAKQLEARGVSREKLELVHSPMGLELNAETPEEIAVSILAEIVMLRRQGTGASMKWMGEPEDPPAPG
jgi:xanthine dehydrogenase accessory factor